MKFYSITFLCFLLFLLFSCGSNVSDNQNESEAKGSLSIEAVIPTDEVKIVDPIDNDVIVVLEKNGITLTEIKSKNNSEASIKLNTKQFKEGENHLSFSVSGIQNYKVAYLTNNFEISQFTSTAFNVELMYGNNVFLALLTDKKGISIKTNKGSELRNVVLGGVESLFDMNQPHLFYLLPQAAIETAILDFYLVNTSIAKNENKIKATINNIEFILQKWAAYKISGLTKAENTVRIQLLDKNNKIIEGPFNDSGERKFKVKI